MASSASQARSCASARRPTILRQAAPRRGQREQGLERQSEGPAGEELVAIDQIEQRHRFAAQRMDDVTIVDDMAMFAVWLRPPAPQGENGRRALEAFQPIVIETHPQPMADQSRGNRVEHLAQREGAGGRDIDVDLLIVGGLADRQLVQRHPLLVDTLGVAEVAAANDVVDEAPPCRKIVEVSRGAQQQSVGERSLEMAVGALDGAVLVADAGIVAGRRHAVMGAERFVALRQILLGVGVEITEGRRETVAAMLIGNAAQRPQGVL